MKTTVLALLVTLVPMVGVADKVEKPAAARVGVVSLQRVIAESAEGRAAEQQLQELGKKMAGQVAARQKELQQPDAGGTPATRQAELQRLFQQSQVEFANAQRQAQAELRTKLSPVLANVAAAHGVDVILNADNTLVWAAPGVDLTADLLTRLNAAAPK